MSDRRKGLYSSNCPALIHSDRLRNHQRHAQRPSLTISETIADNIRDHRWQHQRPSLTNQRPSAALWRPSLSVVPFLYNKFRRQIAQHLTKLPWIALFIGLSDGEVFFHHLTIENPLWQRVFAHFGEVLGLFRYKSLAVRMTRSDWRDITSNYKIN